MMLLNSVEHTTSQGTMPPSATACWLTARSFAAHTNPNYG